MTQEVSKAPRVVDFDHHSPEFAANPDAFFSQMLAESSPVRTEHYGGFWVATRYEDCGHIGRDSETFSSEKDLDGSAGKGPAYGGVLIPPFPLPGGVGELDGEEWASYRRLISPRLAPNVVQALRPVIQRYASSVMDLIIEKGSCDLVRDFTGPVPAIVTMELMGLPLDDWRLWADAMHNMLAEAPDSAGQAGALTDLMALCGDLLQVIAKRRAILNANPGTEPEDMLADFLTAEIDGAPIPDELVMAHILNVIVGGVDTTTSLTAHALLYLHRNHEARELLRADPSKVPAACEEFLRYFAPAPAQARTVTTDTTVGEAQMKENDRVLVCWAAANADPDAFPDPDQVKLDRSPNRHASFGLGPHRCPGSHLARVEFEVMINEVLSRMPDYVIDESELEFYPDRGVANGVVSLPTTFAPAGKIGEPLRL